MSNPASAASAGLSYRRACIARLFQESHVSTSPSLFRGGRRAGLIPMSLGHLTLATREVARTAAFFTESFGWTHAEVPANSPVEVLWLEIGRGQQIHVIFVPDFVASPFENEFGRHVAVFYPIEEFPALKARLLARGAVMVPEVRTTPFERFFFREPVNGYLFEVIDGRREPVL
jgi:predicted enzyme related to lactoylglutathione lyase